DAMYLLALAAAFAAGDGTGAITGTRMAQGLTHVSAGPIFQLTPTDFSGARAALQTSGAIKVQGASGKLEFDPATGEAPSPMEIWQVSGGTFVTIDVVDPPP